MTFKSRSEVALRLVGSRPHGATPNVSFVAWYSELRARATMRPEGKMDGRKTALECFGLGRLERAAQGALAYGILHDGEVQARVLAIAGKRGATVTNVSFEVVERKLGGWRADLGVHLAGDSETIWVEVKIAANLTPVQRRQLASINVLVAPRNYERSLGVPLLTWADLQEHAQSDVLKTLFGEAESTSKWWSEQIGPADIEACLQDSSQYAGTNLHKFLSTADVLLAEELQEAYTALPWTRATGARYFGYNFHWQPDAKPGAHPPRAFWLGAEVRDGVSRFVLYDYSEGKRNEPAVIFSELTCDAILRVVRERVGAQ